MTQKTFDPQTAAFISRWIDAAPRDISGDEMQWVIDNPQKARSGLLSMMRPVSVPENIQPKTLEECYEAFSPELKAKLMLENGHLYFTVQGAALNSKDWQARLETGGHKLWEYGPEVLSTPDYDKNHRLEAGKTYKLGLVFGKEIAEDKKRSTSALQDLGRHKFGSQASEGLKGEFALLIREKFSNAELEAMGLRYIAVLHKPIVDSAGVSFVLASDRLDGSYVATYCVVPDGQWHGFGAFASLAS